MPRGKPGQKEIHPATRSFQAIRIHVNPELADLETGLDAALAALVPVGSPAVITFPSLEPRIVKSFIDPHANATAGNRRLPVVAEVVPAPRANVAARIGTQPDN